MGDYRYDNSLDINFKLFMSMSRNTFDRAADSFPRNFLKGLFDSRYFFDVYLRNSSDAENPDSINIVLASDTDSKLNKAILSLLDGDTVSMFGVNREDGFFCTAMSRVNKLVGSRSNRGVSACTAFTLEKSTDSGNIPHEATDIVFRLPNIKEKGESGKIRHWDEYLKINEQLAREEERALSYRGIRKGENRSKIVFEADTKTLSAKHIGSSVRLVTGTANEDGETVYLGDIIGQISHFTGSEITVTLEPAFQSEVEDFDKTGLLHITKHGDLVQIKRLRRGLQRFARGQAVNPYLDLFMFNAKKARIAKKPVYLSEDRLLLKRLNVEQKAAVEGALAAEDLFLIQGPPGTGKTTAIAEICYQNALEGKKTLIASQTNLAVDNVLSRLVHDPKIRALRKGNAGSVQEEGLPFTEDKVIATWLRNTADSCMTRLDEQKEIVQRISDKEKRLEEVALLHKKFITGMTERNSYMAKVKILKNLLAAGERDYISFKSDAEAYESTLSDAVVRRTVMFELGEFAFDREKTRNMEKTADEISEFIKETAEFSSLCELIEKSLEAAEKWKEEAEALVQGDLVYETGDGEVLSKTDIMMTYGGLQEMLSSQLSTKPKKLVSVLKLASKWKENTIALIGGIHKFIKDCEATRTFTENERIRLRDEKNIGEKIKYVSKILAECVEDYEKKLEEMKGEVREAEEAAAEIVAEIAGAKQAVIDFDSELSYERADIEIAIFKEDISEYYKSLWHEEYANAKAYVSLADKWVKRIRLENDKDYDAFKKLYIDNANVIGVTCSGSGTAEFEENYPEFDVAIIDEVSKATPPELILPVLKAKKLVLVGDHKQLPPMIGTDTYDEVAQQLGIEETEHMKVSLFEELYINAPSSLKVMLTRQYRMHSDIMDTVNRFYMEEGGLICGIPEQMRRHGCQGGLIGENDHAMWIDVPRDDKYRENKSPKNFSYSNEYEVLTIKNILQTMNENLRNNGFEGKKEVGVITFYSNQVSLFEDELMGDFAETLDKISLRTGSVDKFQGIEKPVIICSFVRNNDFGDIGFARDPRRINVALSRARELLMIVGCKDLFCRHNDDYGNIYKMIKEKGGVRNAVDFISG